jgi:hypothetical protein
LEIWQFLPENIPILEREGREQGIRKRIFLAEVFGLSFYFASFYNIPVSPAVTKHQFLTWATS